MRELNRGGPTLRGGTVRTRFGLRCNEYAVQANEDRLLDPTQAAQEGPTATRRLHLLARILRRASQVIEMVMSPSIFERLGACPSFRLALITQLTDIEG